MRKIIWISLFWCALAQVTSAQEALPEIVKQDGERFYLHIVEQGQTLYAISKKYATTVDAIQKANPEIEGTGLKIGQTLQIPVEQVDKRELKRSEVEIKGDTLIHRVLRKETLYAISKKYGIEIDAILASNPQVAQEGLKENTALVIPVSATKQADSTHLEEAQEDSLILHIVKPKETLYALSRQYSISIDSIQIANNGFPEGFKIGQTVRIPRANPRFVPEVKTEQEDTNRVTRVPKAPGSSINVGIFLPFMSVTHDTIDSVSINPSEPPFSQQSQIALDFYRGTRLALDSLQKLGVRASVSFFDTEQLSDTLPQMMQEDLFRYDLFIGPLYRKNFQLVAPFAKEHGIPLVSPVPVSSRILLDQPTVYKMHPSSPAHTIRMARWVATHAGDKNAFLLNSGRIQDQRVFDLAKKYVDRYRPDGQDTIPVIGMYSLSRATLNQLVKDSTEYSIFVPSQNQAYVSELVTLLNDIALSKRGIRFHIYGLEAWSKYDNIETSYWMNLDVQFSASTFIDWRDKAVQHFTRTYREHYETDPGRFAFLGFDAAFYFMKSTWEYGANLPQFVQQNPVTLLSTKLDFIKVGEESGYENQGVFLYRISDFEQVRTE